MPNRFVIPPMSFAVGDQTDTYHGYRPVRFSELQSLWAVLADQHRAQQGLPLLNGREKGHIKLEEGTPPSAVIGLRVQLPALTSSHVCLFETYISKQDFC